MTTNMTVRCTDHYAIDDHNFWCVKLIQQKIENLSLKTSNRGDRIFFFLKKMLKTYHPPLILHGLAYMILHELAYMILHGLAYMILHGLAYMILHGLAYMILHGLAYMILHGLAYMILHGLAYMMT
jgi:hypothetical protein